ncbi:serine--tRNA ligase [Hyphococcus flavus]|uniref:Serine--tRNA ligase n=1 Tax=Hyphococcus flavus TaxID=1866326 RepID=A0AAE9ZAG1_9PROT|nr:serine--tRNA ligase [Hyphococcus flavus]WDI30638.1 serine--tRNA ligase [Hyphococcus flavus]
MFDIKWIRENPDAFDAGLARRGLGPRAGEVLMLDEDARKFTHALNDLQERRNAASKQIGQAKAKGDEDEFNRLREEVDRIKHQMPAAEAEQKKKQDAIRDILSGLPNIPADDVPEGEDEAANVEVRKWGEPKGLNNAKEHFDIGEALGQMDFETAAKMSGSRFVMLKGSLARLERAIASFMLDLHTGEFGYTECQPPLLVRDEALYGTGQLPKFAEDLFKSTGDHWLIPTAEVSLTNIVSGDILDEEELPLRFTAWTPCFRSEAGAAGRDTRGMIRLHQFSKVELVSVTAPDQSNAEHERMTECAEEVLKRLELPYRTMVLCTGDMGFGARKTYDIEVWLPGQGQYREISSVSNCGDFQARRMNSRCRPKGEKQTKFVHTLNGSGLAVGRTLVAVLENYQQADGSVAVPEVLKPYMGGVEKIEAQK